MKREILFRGRRCDNVEWVEGFYFTTPLTDENTDSKPEDGWFFLTGKTRHVISRNSCVYEVNPETVGQFTGLTDKNGKQIFEGDVLSFISMEACYTYVISYENGCFIASHTKTKAHGYKPLKWGSINRFNELSMEIEIIGNRHDNPELI